MHSYPTTIFDHALSKEKLVRGGLSVYDESNLEVGKVYDIDCWKIMPVPCTHSVNCLGAIIVNKVEKLKIFYIIDTEKIPNIADVPFDLAMIECNYSVSKVVENVDNLKSKNFQYHLSMEYVLEWLERRQHKPKNLCLIHLSGSDNLSLEGLAERFNGLCEKCYVAAKGKEFVI